MRRVTCKFVVNSATEPTLSRKYDTGGSTGAQEGDVLGARGSDRIGEYTVVSVRTLQMGAVVSDHNKPESENFKFFVATPSGQMQLFSVLNCDHFKVGDEVYIHLETVEKSG